MYVQTSFYMYADGHVIGWLLSCRDGLAVLCSRYDTAVDTQRQHTTKKRKSKGEKPKNRRPRKQRTQRNSGRFPKKYAFSSAITGLRGRVSTPSKEHWNEPNGILLARWVNTDTSRTSNRLHAARENPFFIKSWKTSAVSTTVWMVETQLCKLRGTSDAFVLNMVFVN